MPASNGPGGFRRGSKARQAEEAIGHSEGLVTVLSLTQADLGPATEAIRIAKDLFATQDYSKALQAARQAESLAITLDERHSGYQKARHALDHRIAELRRIGLPTESFEGVLGRAEEIVRAGVWENGAFVPNHLEARVVLERTDQEAQAELDRAIAASNAIFLAELSIEALVEMQGPSDPKVFAEGAGAELEKILEEATRQLALGDIAAAMRTARHLEDRANQQRADYIETERMLTATEAHLADLRGEGVATERVERRVELARDVLFRGHIDSAMNLANRLAAEGKALGDVYRRATAGLQDADLLYAKLNREGFHSYDAETALRDARSAARKGHYPRAIEHLERAHAAFVRRKDARRALAKAIEETRARVRMLETSGLPFLPDIQELLGRAEREFADGNFSGSSEDLRLAALLLARPPQDEGPKA
jgi:hypothetical protein